MRTKFLSSASCGQLSGRVAPPLPGFGGVFKGGSYLLVNIVNVHHFPCTKATRFIKINTFYSWGNGFFFLYKHWNSCQEITLQGAKRPPQKLCANVNTGGQEWQTWTDFSAFYPPEDMLVSKGILFHKRYPHNFQEIQTFLQTLGVFLFQNVQAAVQMYLCIEFWTLNKYLKRWVGL